MSRAPLPVEAALPALRDALARGTAAVLQAPPGAGKTTRVPLALLHEPWLDGRRIVMLEPRRLAARAAAAFMARTLGEPVGATVGHRVRMDTKVGPATRIEVATEGVLTRLLQDDPALDGVGLVIFDEFHERNLHADLGLALVLQTRAVLRDDLRVLVMSATLDGGPVARLLDDAPVVTSEGRAFPVETRYLPRPVEGRLEPAAARAVRRALDEHDGDVLVFLPGAGEIRRTEALLRDDDLPPGVRVAPLYGAMPPEAQDAALAPSPPGARKVVLATSLAETSLTIEGVRVVVDGGRMRVPRFSPRTGMTRLETVRVSRASADQRRGRAGRVGPGVCLRLWTEGEHGALLPHGRPEIAEADLAPLALELAAWGVRDPAELSWLDAPPPAAFAQARALLAELEALDEAGAVTPHGRRMARLGLHPRLAHMALRAAETGLGGLACELAALLGERDVLRGDDGHADADIRLRVEALRGRPIPLAGARLDRDGLRRARTEAAHLARSLRVRTGEGDVAKCGLLLALAYPDRIGQRRPGEAGRYLLRNGRGAAFPGPQALSASPWIVAAELDGRGRESRIDLAAPVDAAELEAALGAHVVRETAVEWDEALGAARVFRRERLGALVLRESVGEPSPEEAAAGLEAAVCRAGVAALPWGREAERTRQRLAFLHALEPDAWPDVSDVALTERLEAWLAPHLHGLRRWSDLARIDLGEALLAELPWDRRRALDDRAPTHVDVPSGSRIPIDYGDPAAPVLAVRLQEVFGWTETPRIGGGRVPLTLHLLSPAHRPVQVTRDLASFWRSGYFEVRKDLRGRYPKHSWPEDPLTAAPTARARPRQ